MNYESATLFDFGVSGLCDMQETEAEQWPPKKQIQFYLFLRTI